MAVSLRSPCLAGAPLQVGAARVRARAARLAVRASASEDDSFARVAAIEDEIQKQVRSRLRTTLSRSRRWLHNRHRFNRPQPLTLLSARADRCAAQLHRAAACGAGGGHHHRLLLLLFLRDHHYEQRYATYCAPPFAPHSLCTETPPLLALPRCRQRRRRAAVALL